MSNNSLLIDNWTLQCVGRLIEQGLLGEEASELVVDPETDSHAYRKISSDKLNVLCLFQILSQIVLSDSLLVDKDYINVWTDSGQIAQLHSAGVVIPKPFKDIRNEWLPLREHYVRQLCVTESMRKLHKRNAQRYEKVGQSEDPFFSQLIWGGAGMLARTNALKIPYCSHPVRNSWFESVDSLFHQRSATKHLEEFVSSQRIQVFKRIDKTGYLAKLNLPPIAAIILRESNHPSELIKIALQLRDEYKPLRDWLDKLQLAMNKDNPMDELELQRVLDSVDNYVKSLPKSLLGDVTSVRFSIKSLTLAINSNPLNAVLNQFSVRALINKLIMAPAGSPTLETLLRLFGEQKSRLGEELKASLLS